jgi:hypothetical protein
MCIAHVFGTRIGPSEHDPPLIVDADRVLTRQIARASQKPKPYSRAQMLFHILENDLDGCF